MTKLKLSIQVTVRCFSGNGVTTVTDEVVDVTASRGSSAVLTQGPQSSSISTGPTGSFTVLWWIHTDPIKAQAQTAQQT